MQWLDGRDFLRRVRRRRLAGAGALVTVVRDVTQQYLVGELSVLVGELCRAARSVDPSAVAELRTRVECAEPGKLAPLVDEAIADADGLCWASLDRGDLAAFAEQAAVAGALGDFASAARLRR